MQINQIYNIKYVMNLSVEQCYKLNFMIHRKKLIKNIKNLSIKVIHFKKPQKHSNNAKKMQKNAIFQYKVCIETYSRIVL